MADDLEAMLSRRPGGRSGNTGPGRHPGGQRPLGGGGGSGGNTGGTSHTGGDSSCSMWVPVAVALLPYALVRMGWDTWKEARRGRNSP